MSESHPEQPAEKADLDPEDAPDGAFLTTDGGGAPFYPEHNDPERASEFHPEANPEDEPGSTDPVEADPDVDEQGRPLHDEAGRPHDYRSAEERGMFLLLAGPPWCTKYEVPSEDGDTLVFDQINGAVEVPREDADDIITRAEAYGVTLVKVSQ